eukprot:TRINITY_DN687_c0_g2_i1.p1 TRINITY_DN687_c0_g2~~TRINITY_DN687_c0_g2_i1.p1  ORF type:complete len:294 (+),score=25.02 TRINITY_DN687_c0_g2_i1:215-1096(+)
MTVRDLLAYSDEEKHHGEVDVDEHFQLLGLERTHTKGGRRRPASSRQPLEPLVLDKVKTRKGWAEEPKMIAELLETVASANGKLVKTGTLVGVRSDFECVSVPPMSLTAYMKQLSVLGNEAAWPAALSILDRLGRFGGMPFTPLTGHRLLLTAFSLASKEICSDAESSHQRLAKVAGVAVADLHKMESSLLKLLSTVSSDMSWDALIGLQDAPLIKAALPKVVRSALREHALRSAYPSTILVNILPSYLDSCSSGEPSPTSSCSSTSPSFSVSKRIFDAKHFALTHSNTCIES